MQIDDVSWIAMACFVEGIDPSSLALPPHYELKVDSIISELKSESETDAYYRCLETLSGENNGEVE